jgi:hypothetical protein
MSGEQVLSVLSAEIPERSEECGFCVWLEINKKEAVREKIDKEQ